MKNFSRGGSRDRGSSRDRGDFRDRESSRDFGSRSFGPREMHKAVCAECQKECEVPFKPQEGRPVYCRDCYASKKKY